MRPKKELFALRLKLPKGYHILHTHSEARSRNDLVRHLAFRRRRKCGPEQGQSIAGGQFLCDVAGMQHYVYADEDTVLQSTATGPGV